MAAYIGHGGSPNTLWRDVDLDPALETGRWYHLAFSFDGETLTFYLDGVPVGSHAFRYSDHPDYQVMIGGYDNGADVDGFKSDVRVWDHARTAIQIRDFRQRRLTGAEAGLLGYWPLNENDGATVYDVTSNASTGMIVNASWTFDSELSLNYHALFLDRQTGSPLFTNTNDVDVLLPTQLDGYDRYQFTETAVAPAEWQVLDSGNPPTNMVFTTPVPEGGVTLYAWFRDSGETLAPISFPETIEFLRDSVDVEAVASAQVTTHAWGAGMPAVIRAFDLRPQVPPQHEPYLGTDSSATIGLHSLTVSCPEDETPERDDIVTLSTPGDYTVTFTATDRAGNRDAIEIETTVGNMVAHVLGKRLTEDWSGPVNTRSWPEAYVARGPHLPLPPKSDWIVGWPQQWLVDYVGGEFLRVNLPMNTPGEGHFDQHQTLFGYIEGSGSKDVDMRVDFRTHSSTGSHNPGLVARFHPNDPGVEDNTRRGYRLYMQQTGPVEIARIVDGSITTLASQSDVVVKAVWMTARFLVERAPNRQTRLRAKVWEVANPEPETWTLDVLDDTPELQTPGLLGIFGHTSSNRRFDFGEFEAIRIIYGSLIKMR